MSPKELFQRFPFSSILDDSGKILKVDFSSEQKHPGKSEIEILEFVLQESINPPAYLLRVPDFQKKVLDRIMQIPKGEVLTYGELSDEFGGRSFSRAVGQALAKNPLPLIIPCHRVIGGNGDLRGFIGGLEMKFWLLNFEGVKLPGFQAQLAWN